MQSIMITIHIKCANTNTGVTVRLQPNRVGSQMCGPKPLQYNTNTLQALTGFDIKCVDQPWRAPNR